MRHVWALAAGIFTFLSVIAFNYFIFEAFVPDDTSISKGSHSFLPMTTQKSLDGAILMLTTVSLGLFVFVGFMITSMSSRRSGLGISELILGTLFLLFQALSVNMGYLARMEMTGIPTDGAGGFGKAYEFAGVQALLLLIAFSICVSLCLSLLTREPVP